MGATFADWPIRSLNLRYDNAGGANNAADTTSYGIGVDHDHWSDLSFGVGVGVLNAPNAGTKSTR